VLAAEIKRKKMIRINRIFMTGCFLIHVCLLEFRWLMAAVVTVYLVIKLDWGNIIGKCFPWTLNDNYDKKGNDNTI
jgi:hypothetical protein